jgi:lantibiotic modifying enzyme
MMATSMERVYLMAEASSIADQLRVRCRQAPDGDLIWTGPEGYGTELTPLREVRLGPHLYDGTTGIALFFAALARAQGESEHRDLALRILKPLRRQLSALVTTPERADRLVLSVGGLIGLGSLVYGLLKIGELLDEPALIREAQEVTVLITSERIARDQRVRIQTGSAGAILALLALHARLPEPNPAGRAPLNIACECGQHLLETRISFEGRPRAWALSPGKPPLSGFSYGAAGVSYALLRLYEATEQQDFLDAASEGLAFVRDLYSPEQGCWRDIRPLFESRYRPRRGTWRDWWASGTLDTLEKVSDPLPAEGGFLPMWCHGGPGIALGQIGAISVNDSSEIRGEIDGALKRARSYARGTEDLTGPDDLCCGHMGLVELFLSAAQKLDDENALDDALLLMERVRRRAESEGRYELSAARGKDIFTPFLFQGIAGVGYSLVRLAAPGEIPCLLLLE